MELEELQRRRAKINSRYDNVLSNMETLSTESTRVGEVAYNSKSILEDLNREFESKTGLQGQDIVLLFIATGLQCLRIYGLDKLTKREKAGKIKNEDGSYTLEGKIHKVEKDFMKRFDNQIQESAKLYYAPLNQIIASSKVPYDCTTVSEKKSGFFQGANHRYATLGHDPILGLFFGTANILTNTISTTHAPILGISTSHVSYKSELMKRGKIKISTPMIQIGEGVPCSTIEMCMRVKKRFEEDKTSVVAALIKQILHIGTDMYTKLGIQLPGENLILSPAQTEMFTKYLDWGSCVKAGVSSVFSGMINGIISFIHNLMYSRKMGISRDIYNVRTKKIIMYSNAIASGSNIIATGVNTVYGNKMAIKDLDIGGILVTVHHLMEDPKFIRKVKQEYITGKFDELIWGDGLDLLEV